MLWWCLLGPEWNVSFLPPYAWSHDTRDQSLCKLHSDHCLSTVLHNPQGAGCHFTVRGVLLLAVASLPRSRLAELALLLVVPCSFAFGKIPTSDLPCQTA